MSTSVSLFIKLFDFLSKGNYSTEKQVEKNSTYYARNEINYKLIKINFDTTLLNIHNQIRALIFPPYQLPVVNEKKIIKSKLFDDHIILTDINNNEQIYQ